MLHPLRGVYAPDSMLYGAALHSSNVNITI